MSREQIGASRVRGISVGSRLRGVFGFALDVALPPLCASCHELVADTGICPECWAKLSFIAPPFCERLGIPFAYDPGPGILSMQAIADPPAYARARAPRCATTTSPEPWYMR